MAKERNEVECRNFKAHIAQYEIWMIVNVEESSFNDHVSLHFSLSPPLFNQLPQRVSSAL
jgi:hypothetical protein